MIEKYKDMTSVAARLLGVDSPAYYVAEMAASSAYLGCIILEAPRVYKIYLQAKMAFKRAEYPEYAGVVDNLYREMRNESANKSTGLDPRTANAL